MTLRPMTTIAVTLVGLFLAIQIVRPARTNPPVDPTHTIEARVDVPPAVDAILMRACIDCHSNETRWPWYSNLAPVSWLLASDVNGGRHHMNVSEWNPRASHHGDSLFEEICNQVRAGDMPPWYYRPLHPAAHLSADDVSKICAWTANSPTERRPSP